MSRLRGLQDELQVIDCIERLSVVLVAPLNRTLQVMDRQGEILGRRTEQALRDELERIERLERDSGVSVFQHLAFLRINLHVYKSDALRALPPALATGSFIFPDTNGNTAAPSTNGDHGVERARQGCTASTSRISL